LANKKSDNQKIPSGQHVPINERRSYDVDTSTLERYVEKQENNQQNDNHDNQNEGK
jgi:hypothetical protein